MTGNMAETESMRLSDFRLATDLLIEAVDQEHGARDRIAERYGIRKSVISNQVERIELFFDVKLFTGPQRKTPTAAGRVLATHGPRLLKMVEDFGGMLRDAQDWRVIP
jgi:DNA-binding transcriptional LysR family regulator